MRLKPSICLFFFLFSVLHSLFSQNAFPRLAPDPKALDYYRLGQRMQDYSWQELAEISLWASGDSSAANLQKIHETVEALNNSADLPVSKKEKADYILTYLHRNFLRTYSLNQTRLDTVLSTGRYNCVSSAVLYMILCQSAGIETSGVVTRDHALITVHIDGEDIDVETTNRYGFDPGNRREFHDQFGRLTGFAYVPVQNYRDRQTIGKIELVSLILNNRISDFERQNRYADSVPLAIDRAALLLGELSPDTFAAFLSAENPAGNTGALFEDPRKDLMDRLFNYSAWLLRVNREEDVLRWTADASSMYPGGQRWQEFTFAAVNNRTARFIRENKITEARDFLENQKSFLIEENYVQLDLILIDAELLRSANQILTAADGDAVVRVIEQARTDGKITDRRAAQLTTFAIQKTAAILCAPPGRDWRAAIQYIENALEQIGAHRELEQVLRTYRNNLAADFHNRFAAEWNAGKYDEARRIIDDGLAEFPDDRQLLRDRDLAERNRN